MNPSMTRIFRALAGEAIRDAVRRRIVPVIVAVSLLSLMMVDGCTSCASPTVMENGVPVELSGVSGWVGVLIFAVLSLWVMVLAGVLASDHLSEPLEDGSAALVLSRPVGRSTFALARLVGVLVITALTGAVLLGGAAAMLHARNGVSLEAAIWAGGACATGALVVAALAMTASLFLPRVATVLVVLISVAIIATVNAIALSGVELGGIPWAIDRFGPPLGTALAATLAPWVEPVQLPVNSVGVVVRGVAWAVAGVSLLVVVFRRRDVPS